MNTKLPIGLVALALALGVGNAVPAARGAEGELQRVVESDFGKLANGTAIKAYTLTNSKGTKARVITLGAIIAGIQAPDKDGKLINVVAAADDAATMERYGPRGYTVGRIANRVEGSQFTLDGQVYRMNANEGRNSLHSGNANFGVKVWEGKALPAKAHEGSAELTYKSPDGEGGFPGNLTVKLTFSLNDDNEFRLDYEATTDKATPLSLTNHAYFNLAGAAGWGNTTAGSTAEQELWVDADKMVVMRNQLPTGEIAEVKGTAFDFTKPTVIGTRTPPTRNYDTPFVLNSGGGKLATVARLRDPASGRTMEVRTDQPSLQFYNGQRPGIALETQHYPDSVNHANFPSIILKPGDTFKSTTVYAFSAK